MSREDWGYTRKGEESKRRRSGGRTAKEMSDINQLHDTSRCQSEHLSLAYENQSRTRRLPTLVRLLA